MPHKPYHAIVKSYEDDLRKYGDNFRGVGWSKKKEYASLRYKIMLEVVRESDSVSILDVGCGASHLLEYMIAHQFSHITYSGLDLSQEFLNVSKRKFPEIDYYLEDILSPKQDLPKHSYLVMNGLFTRKGEMRHEQMWDYCQAMISKAFDMSTHGIAFNIMSKYLDWEREDLFHLSFDDMAGFLDKNVSRYFTIRHDYGLFEYTVYVYKKPLHSES